MLTVAEYAKKAGRSPQTIRNWCRNGLLPGSQKQQSLYGEMYLVPEDAPVPQLKQGRPPAQCNVAGSADPTGKTYTQKEMCDFIVRNCTKMTYGQISRELGIPAAEVRRIYDHLHDAYGV